MYSLEGIHICINAVLVSFALLWLIRVIIDAFR